MSTLEVILADKVLIQMVESEKSLLPFVNRNKNLRPGILWHKVPNVFSHCCYKWGEMGEIPNQSVT